MRNKSQRPGASVIMTFSIGLCCEKVDRQDQGAEVPAYSDLGG